MSWSCRSSLLSQESASAWGLQRRGACFSVEERVAFLLYCSVFWPCSSTDRLANLAGCPRWLVTVSCLSSSIPPRGWNLNWPDPDVLRGGDPCCILLPEECGLRPWRGNNNNSNSSWELTWEHCMGQVTQPRTDLGAFPYPPCITHLWYQCVYQPGSFHGEQQLMPSSLIPITTYQVWKLNFTH